MYHPLSFQPGGVLGLFQPPLLDSRLLVDYDTGIVYYLPLSSEQLEPGHTVVDIRDLQTANNLPLVSVVIGKYSITIVLPPLLFSHPQHWMFQPPLLS